MSVDELEHEALKLSHHERARLAERLLSSLDEDSEVEQAWRDETERRLADLESGAVQGVPVQQVMQMKTSPST